MADTKKFLDIDGVQVLYQLLSLQDYPNNDILAAVIDAIDETKLNKNKFFVGTQAEYREAVNENKISVGAIVVLTDVD